MSGQPTAIIHGTEREIMCPELNDAQVASTVFMHTTVSHGTLMASLKPGASTELRVALGIPQIARDRILYLSQQLEQAISHLRHVTQLHSTADTYEAELFVAQSRTAPSAEPDVMKRP